MKTDICFLLGLPEFMILKQDITENRIFLDVEPKTSSERFPFCGFAEFKKT